jgi:hypothetical protein
MAAKNILQVLPTNLIQIGVDKRDLDNGNWFVSIGGQLLRCVTSVDPGAATPRREPITEDQRMGAVEYLRDFSEVISQVQLTVETHQRAVWEAILGPQGEYFSATEANARNVVGSHNGTTFSVPTTVVAVGHLVLLKVELESGGILYDAYIKRQLYGDVKTGTTKVDYLFAAYNHVANTFLQMDGIGPALLGTITWGDNRYMGECDITGVALTTNQIFTYDPAEQYAITLGGEKKFAEIPEWADIEAGDLVIIASMQYLSRQFGTAYLSSSYQAELSFDSAERRPLELWRMLGDAPGGVGRRMVRRYYPFARLAGPPTEATSGNDGTSTERTATFDVFPDTSEFGHGQFYDEQTFIWS